MAEGLKKAKVKKTLEMICQVQSVRKIRIGNEGFIEHLLLQTDSLGIAELHRLKESDADALFEFYAEGLSEKPKHLFAPYPLFHSPPESPADLRRRIAEWRKERNWTALNLVKDERIIGFCVLKRIHTENVTSGIAVRDDYLKKGAGLILQTAIIEQARLLNVKSFHVKIVSDNTASVRLHEKCGFRRTKVVDPPVYEEILEFLRDMDIADGLTPAKRHIIEMVVVI